MKKFLLIVFSVFVIGCSDDATKNLTSSSDVVAIVDGVCIDKKAIEKQVNFRMGIFEVNRRLNFPMHRVDLRKVREQQQAKYLKIAKNEVLFKALISAAAKKVGIVASPEDVSRIRRQYEMNLGRREGSYSIVTSTVHKVGFLREFEGFIDEEARSLSYVRSIHPEISIDISESDIDAYIVKLNEKDRKIAEFNAKSYHTATNVLERLKRGEDFAKLAKEFSCAEDKDEGGDMGDIILSGESAYSNYAPAYLSALMMKDGAFSEVVTTPLGVEIFQVLESREQENQDDPIIKHLRHICFELRPAVGEYTRDSVGRRLMSDRLKELYGKSTILRALDTVDVEVTGVTDVKGYFLRGFAKGEEKD